MLLIVIDFTFLEKQDNEIAVKKLEVADSHSNKISSYVLIEDTNGKKYLCLTLGSIKLLTTGVTGMLAMFHIQSWKLCYIAKYHLLLQFIALNLRKQTLLAVSSTAVIDITLLGCPELADSLPAIGCTFACHKSKHVCALLTAYSLAQLLNYYFLSLQYTKCPPQPGYY